MNRLFVIGIDAASSTLVERWSDDLPTLSTFRNSSHVTRIRGLEHFYVGSTWPSLYTGSTPGEHGHHSLVQLVPGTYEYREMSEGPLVHGLPFWRELADKGCRVAVLDVPLTELDPGLNGVQTVEWGSHDALYGFRATPESLEKDILARFGEHPMAGGCDGSRETAADYHALVSRLIDGVKGKAAVTRHVLDGTDWDFAMQVFTEAHCTGHQCWHLHDEAHPAYDAAIAGEVGDPLKRVYSAIDRELGELLEIADEETTVVIMSAHDMSFWYGAQFLLTDILCRLGHTAVDPAQQNGSNESLLDKTWLSLPGAIRTLLRPLVHAVKPPRQHSGPPKLCVDTSNSLCFPVFNGQPVSGIRLNRKGREPRGLLAADEVDAFIDRLRADLLEIVDTRTGQPAVSRVVATADEHAGDQIDALPDVLVHWNDLVPTGSALLGDGASATLRFESPRIGTVEGTNNFGRSGEHRPDGFMMVRPGAGVTLPSLGPSIDITEVSAFLQEVVLNKLQPAKAPEKQ